MRIYYAIPFLLLPLISVGQIITTIAGGGTGGDGSLATATSIHNPCYLAFDRSGNLYFSQCSSHKVRKISTSGIVSTVAGTGNSGFSGDGGMATDAELNQPAGIAIDTQDNIFFSDGVNNRIRKVSASTGIISTVVGSIGGYGGDGGMASAAMLRLPVGLLFDKVGNMYINDCSNLRVRKVSTTGIITTVVGNGLGGWSGNGGPATAAKCFPWGGICMDNTGNLYISEWSYGVVRKINTMGIITIIAGDTTTPHVYNGNDIAATNAKIDPYYVVVNGEGTVYISDAFNHRIRAIGLDGIIHTVAGNGIGSSTGDNGLAITATVHTPTGMALDSCGNLYFGQTNTPRIRKITFNPGCWPANVNYVNSKNAIVLHPNPATTALTIENVSPNTTYQLCNLLGSVVEYGNLWQGNNNISVQHLPQGMYVLLLTDDEGKRTVHKVVKE